MNPHEHMPSLEGIEAGIKAGQERIVRERLRDAFAAAALTGLLAAPTDKDRSMDYWARLSYEAADAMLRERVTKPMPDATTVRGSVTPVSYAQSDEKRGDSDTAGATNHDAVPEAQAACEDCQPQAAAESGNPVRSSNAGFTGNTQKPVAWAVVYPNDEVAVIAFRRSDANERASASDRIVPLYRSPAITDEDRVVRLPSITAATRHGLSRWEDGWMQGLRDARKALDAAGVKWEVAHE